MKHMQLGEIYKYMPTSTVGKVVDIREKDGKTWALLDFTGLWYDVSKLTPADVSEYKEISFKYRERSFDSSVRSVEELAKEIQDVDISDFTPSGGGCTLNQTKPFTLFTFFFLFVKTNVFFNILCFTTHTYFYNELFITKSS